MQEGKEASSPQTGSFDKFLYFQKAYFLQKQLVWMIISGICFVVVIIITVVLILYLNRGSISIVTSNVIINKSLANNSSPSTVKFKKLSIMSNLKPLSNQAEKQHYVGLQSTDRDQKHFAVREYVRNNLQKQPQPSDMTGMAEIGSGPTSGGLMNTPEASKHKWDPKKMLPSTTNSVRPHNSLAATYGPSLYELALALPTQSQMYAAGKNNGPKMIRKSQPVRDTGFCRPIILPQMPSEDYWKGRGNRPRITAANYEQQIRAQQRVYGNSY